MRNRLCAVFGFCFMEEIRRFVVTPYPGGGRSAPSGRVTATADLPRKRAACTQGARFSQARPQPDGPEPALFVSARRPLACFPRRGGSATLASHDAEDFGGRGLRQHAIVRAEHARIGK